LDKDLGFDSLARVELMTRLEKAFAISLGEQALFDAETPRDLQRAITGIETRKTVVGTDRGLPTIAAVTPRTGIVVPHQAPTLVDVLEWHVANQPERPHIRLYSDVGEDDVITYAELWAMAEGVGAGLQARSVGSGQTVAIMLPTGRDYFAAFFGVLLAGAVPVSIYPPARMTQIEEHLRRHVGIVGNCQARILIAPHEARRFGQLLRSQLDALDAVVTIEDLAAGAGNLARPLLGPGDTAFLQYTSGSTGRPKGVVLSHANLLANIRAMGDFIKAGPDDVFVSWLPLYHDMGLIGAWLGSLHYATPLVVMSPLSFLARPKRWLDAIHRYRATLSAAPNFAYEYCLRRISEDDLEGLDLGSWRLAFNGAEAVSAKTLNRFCERFAAHGFRREAMYPVYGLAENAVGLTFPPLGRGPLIDQIERPALMEDKVATPAAADDETALEFVACGQPLPGHEARIVDAAGRELPERRIGRLQFRGPSACSGYFRNLEQTRRLFDGDWLETGDMGYVAAGDVFVTGRIKDVIIRAGRNIHPEELEEAIGELEGIRKGNVAIFASDDLDTGTERLVVLAETRKRDPADLEELIVRINALASDLIGTPPDDVALVPPRTVRKTSSGKIRRASCREVYEQGLIGKPGATVRWQLARLALSGIVPYLRRATRSLGAGLFAAYAWALFVVMVTVAWFAAVPMPREAWRWTVLRGFIKLIGGLTGTRLHIAGLGNLADPKTACVYVANHASYLDSIVLTAALPRNFSFIAKAELAGNVFTRVLLERIGAEFVERLDREKGVADARRIAATLAGGRSLMFFPEGTLMRMPGLLPFHMGAFQAAVAAGAPVVPVVIRGTRAMLRGGTWFPRRGTLCVEILEPVPPPAAGAAEDAGAWGPAIALRDEVRARMLAHCGEPDLGLERPPV